MHLLIDRIDQGPGSTIAQLHYRDGSAEWSARFCWILEEAWHEVKVPGETCIPPGTYELELVHTSPMALRYYDRWDWFRGLPSFKDVPDFTLVRLHPGNDAEGEDDDTDGCPLPGERREQLANGGWKVLDSVAAYRRILEELVYPAFDRGERVFVTVSDDKIRL